MAVFSGRPCVYDKDQAPLVDLLLAHRLVVGVEHYPTTWRFRLLLTSRVWDPLKDTRVWEDKAGGLSGFAMLWRRSQESPYLALERLVHPDRSCSELMAEELCWGVDRAREIAEAQHLQIMLYTQALADEDVLKSQGFEPNPPDPQEHTAYYSCSLQKPLPKISLPPGYIMRQLTTADKIASYQELYDFSVVDPEHLREMLVSDEYSFLVVEDARSQFQAYCESSICRKEWDLSGRRIGWIDYIGTRPEQRGKGLGRAVLLEGLKILQEWGAEDARLVTISSNIPAVRLYESTGFVEEKAMEGISYKKVIVV